MTAPAVPAVVTACIVVDTPKLPRAESRTRCTYAAATTSPHATSARRLKLSPFARSLERLFAQRWLRRARREGYDGVLCGHIHIPGLRRVGHRIYANCGDWVDCNTFLALSQNTLWLGNVPPRGRGELLLRHKLPLEEPPNPRGGR